MNNLYPIFIKLYNKTCVVIGGGKVAERKVKALLDASARVTVISSKLTEELRQLAHNGSINYVHRKFKKNDLKGAFLVIAATDDNAVNRRIYLEAEQFQTLVNVVDVPELCNFYVPSTFQRGDLKIAISTNGKAPALARLIRKKLEKLIPSQITQDIEQLSQLRTEQKKNIPEDQKTRECLAGRQAQRVINSYL